MSDSKHTHKDGWTSDETFRSMRRNCEEYKKKDIELIKFREENAKLKEEITKLKEVNAKFKEVNVLESDTKSVESEICYKLLTKYPDLKEYSVNNAKRFYIAKKHQCYILEKIIDVEDKELYKKYYNYVMKRKNKKKYFN